MTRKTIRHFAMALAAATALSAAGCAGNTTMEERDVTADRIARPAFMVERVIPAGPFNLMAWERMHVKRAPATVYIEGDGLAWTSPRRVSLDPTPKNPVALHLAAMDRASNVAWLARPCQYTGAGPANNCESKYWTDSRFAPEVVSSYHAALDNMKRLYGLTGFHLVGYSGGAAVAALVAAQRDDILSFRSVAGNLDHETWTELHGVSPLTDSLNPVTVAPELTHLPQHHFIGGQDEIVPPAVFHSWAQAAGKTDCLKYSFIMENEHEAGWVDKWPELLTRPIECAGPPAPAPAPVPQEFLDVKK